jgi:hypothetical protein
MVTAAHSNNGRNQSTCIEKGKPKNNNKIRQHEKNKPIFHFPLSFFLVQSLFCSNSHHCNFHFCPSRQPPVMHAASPLPPPSRTQRRQRQQRFFTIPQICSGGCMQIISTSLRTSTTSTLNYVLSKERSKD